MSSPSYDKGKEISGLDELANWQQGFVFHAGTAKENNRWLTTGGRDGSGGSVSVPPS